MKEVIIQIAIGMSIPAVEDCEGRCCLEEKQYLFFLYLFFFFSFAATCFSDVLFYVKCGILYSDGPRVWKKEDTYDKQVLVMRGSNIEKEVIEEKV